MLPICRVPGLKNMSGPSNPYKKDPTVVSYVMIIGSQRVLIIRVGDLRMQSSLLLQRCRVYVKSRV